MSRESREEEKGQSRRITFLGLFVGAISIMIVLVFGWFALSISINASVKESQCNFHNKAMMLAEAAEDIKGRSNEDVLSTIDNLWKSQREEPSDEYLSIVGRDCLVILNTAHPEMIGRYAENGIVRSLSNFSAKTTDDLSDAHRIHTLGCMLYSGKKEVVAFAAAPKKGWVLSVHRSRSAIMQQVKKQFQGLRTGFLLACLVLIPFSLVLLYFAIHLVRGIGEKAEQGWEESERRFLAFMNHLPAGAFIKDCESNLLYLNEYAEEFLGLDESWIGKSTREAIQSKGPAGQMIEEDRKVLFDGYLISEKEVRDSMDISHIFEIHKFPIEHEDGSKLLGGLMFDITERKKEEEKSKRLASIVESSDDAIFSTNPIGCIACWNRAAERLFGYEKDEVMGRHVSLLAPPGKIENIREAGKKLRSGQTIDHFETMARKKDGGLLEICVSVSPIKDLKGNIVGASSICRDISEKKSLESQLRQAQKMEAIGTLAGGIAHDFNNILAGVIGLCELTLLEIPENSSPHKHISQVVQAGNRAAKLVRQILAFSRQQEHTFIPLSIDPLIKETLRLLRSSLPSTIEIRKSVRSDLGVIQGDPTQIHQVLMNLCTNAEYAMREMGGVLEVTLEKLDIDERSASTHPDLHRGAYIKLEVKDTGKGMDSVTMTRIFDPYFTTKGLGEGTGMGLAVVQGIVKEHHGKITVESEKGKGSIFRVYFPVSEMGKVETRYQEKEPQTPLPTGNERILLVDDEKVLADVGSEILDGLGYQVTVRTSSIEALELFKVKSEYFDLVVTDMTMPNMNGEQLSRKLMKIRPNIPIILCTGFSHTISEENARNMGIRAFAMKPLIRKDLAGTVRRALDGN